MLKITYYIFRQLGLTTLFLTVVLTAIIWLSQSVRVVEGVLNKGLPMKTFFILTSYLLPNLVATVLPISLLVAVVYTYNRLIADQELAVMRSAGMSHWQLAKPAVFLATVLTAILYFNTIYVMPNVYAKKHDIEYEVKKAVTGGMLQPGEFNNLNDMMVYVRSRTSKNDMKGILIYNIQDKKQPFLITAESGSLLQTDEGIKLVLIDGARQDLDKTTNNPSMLYFDQYIVQLDSSEDEERKFKYVNEYGILDLLHPTKEMGPLELHPQFIAQGHQKLLSPLHTIAFSLIALAILLHGEINRRRRTKKIITIFVMACGLQILFLSYMDLYAKAWVVLPLSYMTMALSILIPFMQIREWALFHSSFSRVKLQGGKI